MTDRGHLLVVTGPRAWGKSPESKDAQQAMAEEIMVDDLVEKAAHQHPDLVVFHGGARGLDSLVGGAAEKYGLTVVEIPYFGAHGKAGGYVRNSFMVHAAVGISEGMDGWVVKGWAFGSKEAGGGTGHCAGEMESNGLPLRWWPRPNHP